MFRLTRELIPPSTFPTLRSWRTPNLNRPGWIALRADGREKRVADQRPTRPTEVSERRGRFDALADRASTLTARSGFFVSILAGVSTWLVIGPFVGFSHHWIDVVVVVVGVVTLMLVALLENEQWRNAKATQRKLNALAEAVAHILAADKTAGEQVDQLRAAYGLEKRESISD